MHELTLLPLAFLSSCLAGAIGMGGGVLLIAVMPGFVPVGAILPLHAATQLASNASRALFGWRHIDVSLILPVALGAALGAWLGGEIYRQLDLSWLPMIIGTLILLFTWLPLPEPRGSGRVALLLLGFYQTGLGMLAGATGPVGAAVLMRHNSERDWLVVNTAVYMSLNHLLRTLAFVLLGFAFAPWWPLLTGLVIAVTAGSWLGTRLRSRIPQLNFQRWFRILVSLLAVRMIAMPLLS